MKTLNPKDNLEQKRLLKKFNTLKKRYADVFDFLIFSVSTMTDMPICTITLFEGNEVFVIATNDNSIEKIWPLSPAIKIESNNKVATLNLSPHSVEKFDIKFYKSFPILDPDSNILGSLNIFDDKERLLTDSENEILARSIKQINRWVASKAKEQVGS